MEFMLVTVSYVHQKKNEAIKLFLLVVHFSLGKPDAETRGYPSWQTHGRQRLVSVLFNSEDWNSH